jgi:ketosteroid isomerase-like protein
MVRIPLTREDGVRHRIILATLALGVMGTSAPIAVDQDDAATIIGLERAALDRWGNGDPEGFLGTYAPEITYFDPFQPQRVDSVQTMRKLYGPLAGKIHVDNYDMIAPRVQQYGDMAVLTYNLVSHVHTPEGKQADVRWNSTSVYHRVSGRWRTIHSHWSFTGAAQQPPTG